MADWARPVGPAFVGNKVRQGSLRVHRRTWEIAAPGKRKEMHGDRPESNSCLC